MEDWTAGENIISNFIFFKTLDKINTTKSILKRQPLIKILELI